MTKAIIIGGGIAGCSTAYALAKRGIAVTLIERHHHLAQEASGNPVAMLYPKFSSAPSTLSTVALNGFAFTLSLLEELDIKNKIYNTCGQIQLAFDTREQGRQDKLFKQSPIHKTLQFLDASKASELAGIKLNKGGLYLSQAGWLKPQVFCKILTRSLLITKVVSTNALELKKINKRWQVLLSNDESLEADIVVICNANDIKQFEQSKNIPITSVRGQVNFFPENPISKQIKTIVCSDHYLSPAVDGFNSIGTSYTPNDFNANLSDQDTRANLQALRKISLPLFDAIKMQNVTGRVAWRSATKDYLPLAGQLLDDVKMFETKPRYNVAAKSLPWLKGLYMNAGHGSKGMITAPLCGELVAVLANNEPLSNESLSLDTAIASKLNPSRFTMRALALKQLASALY